MRDASWAAVRAASNRRSWNRFRAWTSKSSTRSKSTEESRPRIRPASRSAGACASSSMRISPASGALARASTRSHFFLRPWRLTRCRSPRSRSRPGRSRPRRYSTCLRSASARTVSGSGKERRVSISRTRSACRPRSIRWARASSRRTSVGRCESVSWSVRGVGRSPSESKLPCLNKHSGRLITRPGDDSGATLRSPTGPSGIRGDRRPRRDGAAALGRGTPSRSRPAKATRDRSGADGPERSRSRECGTRPRSLSSGGRTPAGRRRSRPIRGRLRCCTVCGPARPRSRGDGPGRRRSRRTGPPRNPIDRSADGSSGGRRQRLFSAAAFASLVSFRSGPSVFKDQGKLSFDYLPDKMVHREKQTQRLFSLLRPIVEAGASSNAFLYGAVGTGKTHTAKRFCLDFRKYASESDRAVDWDVVNCRQRMGDDAVLLRLLQHFDPHFPERGFSIAEKMESLRKHLEKHKLHFIVILDEVDALLKKSGADLIYSFARIAEEGTTTKGNISMILISQRPNALEYMDPAALSTFRRSNVVEFPRYDRTELEDIVQGRVALAMHPGTVDDDMIDLIEDMASEFGDARYAIELLEKAGMLADEERAEEVAAEHVRGAKSHVHPIDVEERLGLLDVPKKLVLLSIARKSRKKAYITMGEAEEAYAVVCEEYGEKPRAHTQFWKYVKELDALGLVDA